MVIKDCVSNLTLPQGTENPGTYSSAIPKNVLSLYLQIFLYLDTFECNTTVWFSQSEAVLHSNLQILMKKSKNVLEDGW